MRHEQFDTVYDYALIGFSSLLNVKARPFGAKNSPMKGFSDDSDGVQWNLSIEKSTCRAYFGINLEGKKYNDWPVAHFIERELKNPTLLDIKGRDADNEIHIHMRRDAWQVASRPPILERNIGPSPIPLSTLTPEIWRSILIETYNCLDASNNHRGRAKQMVTLKKSGTREMPVSPHLQIYQWIWQYPPTNQTEVIECIKNGLVTLQPIYDLVRKLST